MAKTYTFMTFQNFTLSKWSCLKLEKTYLKRGFEMSIRPKARSDLAALHLSCVSYLRCSFDLKTKNCTSFFSQISISCFQLVSSRF